MTTSEELRNLCMDEKGDIRPKPECRAILINKLILDDLVDIDEAEGLVDKSLREWNLWNEPTLEELLAEDEGGEEITGA